MYHVLQHLQLQLCAERVPFLPHKRPIFTYVIFHGFKRRGSFIVVNKEQESFANLYSVGIVVKKQDPTARHLFGLHHCLEVRQQTHVLRHVGREHLHTTKITIEKQYIELIMPLSILYNQTIILNFN